MTSPLVTMMNEIFDAEVQTIAEDLDLRELEGWDSLSHMMFIARLEKEFDIVLSGDDIADMLSVVSIRRILQTKHNIQV